MTDKEMKEEIESIAQELDEKGYAIAVNYGLPYIVVTDSSGEVVINEQGDDAQHTIDDAEAASEKFDVNDEDWMLYHLEGAGML